MSLLKAGLYSYLSGVSGVTALASTRIYPDFAPTSATFPRVTYSIVANEHTHNMAAASGITAALVQVDAWATTSVSRANLSEALRAALDGRHHQTMGSVNVESCSLEGESDEYEAPNNAGEVGVFRTRMDFRIWYRESVPAF